MAPHPRPTFEKPLEADCVEGQVVVTGPEHMHGAFTADAAQESAKVLENMAEKARRPRPRRGQPSQTGSSEA